MNITYIVRGFPTLTETFIIDQIAHLLDLGHQVNIISGSKPKMEKIHKVIERYNLLDKTVYVKRSNRYPGFIITPEFIDAVLFSDIIHSHFATWSTESAMNTAEMLNIPFIFTAHAFDIFKRPDVIRLNQMAKKASKIITISEFNKNYIAKLIGEFYRDKITIIRCGININKFSPCIKQTSNRVIILICGRFVEKKGIPYAIRAFSKLSATLQAELRIIGDGPMKGEIKQLISRLGLKKKVKLFGSLLHSDVLDQMRQADIFLLPSVTAENGDREGLPVSILEAQATGLPVISTHHTGIPEGIIDGQTGYIVHEKDIDAIASRLELLIKNPDLRIKMGKKGRDFIKSNFNIIEEIEKLEIIFHDLVSTNSSWSNAPNNIKKAMRSKTIGILLAMVEQNTAIRKSLSWRITAPLRKFKQLFPNLTKIFLRS